MCIFIYISIYIYVFIFTYIYTFILEVFIYIDIYIYVYLHIKLISFYISYIFQEVTVQGWVRTSRFAENHAIMFVELTDGSTVKSIQTVLTVSNYLCIYVYYCLVIILLSKYHHHYHHLHAATTAGMDAVAKSGGVGASLKYTL
jgi:hypothetical protein